MADSDPRKVRPLRHPAESPSFDAEDDPLVELARMVSEDSGFSGGKGEKPRLQRDEPIDRNALSADLEAELLQELEASFAPRPPLTAVASRAPAAPAPPPPTDDADELLRSIEEQLGAFERNARPTPSAVAQPGEDREGPEQPSVEMRSEDAEEERQAETAGDGLPADEFEQRSRPARVADEDREIGRRGPGVLLRAAAWPDRNARPRPQRPEPRFAREPADDGRQESARENRRATARQFRRSERQIGGRPGPARSDADGPGPVAPGIVGAAAGWDQIGREEESVSAERESAWQPPEGDYRRELRTTFGDLDEVQEPSSARASDAKGLETGIAAEIEPGHADSPFGENWQDEVYPDAEALPDDPRVAAAAPPRRGSQRQDTRKGLLVVAGVLGVVVLGGAAAFFMRGGDEAPSGPPPVISAQDGPVKVTPPEESEQVAEETVGEAVYNRVAGRATETEEQIVDSAEEPEEIPRIVMPAPEAEADVVGPVGDADNEIAAAGADASAASEANAAPVEAPAGPRRVRTFVVRPDGSIVTAAESTPGAASSEAPAQEPSFPAAASADAEPIEPAAVPTVAVNGAGEPDSASAETSTAAISSDGPVEAENAPASETATEPADSAPEIRAGLEEVPAADAAEDVTAAAAPPVETAAIEPSPPPEAPPPSRARRDDSAPVDLLSAAAAPRQQPAPAPAAAPGGGWIVQISSQRTREEAQSSWDSMRGRYPSILGDLQPSIQQTDLGDRGIYHRLRVGPWPTRAEAIEVCEALQTAGGSCFVAQ